MLSGLLSKGKIGKIIKKTPTNQKIETKGKAGKASDAKGKRGSVVEEIVEEAEDLAPKCLLTDKELDEEQPARTLTTVCPQKCRVEMNYSYINNKFEKNWNVSLKN